MKLLLIGGPADGEVVDIRDPGSGGLITWAVDGPRGRSLYHAIRWAFSGVGWFYIGVHQSVKEHEQSKLAVHAMLRPELVEILRPIR
jgi:hypothetical protein